MTNFSDYKWSQTCFGLTYDFILALQISKSLIVFYF